MPLLFALVILLLSVFSAHAFPARIVAVADGDTVTVEPEKGGGHIKVRLYGIDAPERRQPFGEAARQFVIAMTLRKRLEVEDRGTDRYGRVVAVVFLENGESLQAPLLLAGLAWVWPRYCRICPEWNALQEMARKRGRGLWSQENPIPPWEWRRSKKRK